MKLKVTYAITNINVPRVVARVYRVTPFGLPDGILADIFTDKGQLLSSSDPETPAVVPPPGSDGLTLISDENETTGMRWGTYSVTIDSLENYLTNGGFTFAQRQAPGADTTITNEKYSADQWRCTRETADLQYSRQDGSSESGLTSRYFGKFTKITNAGKFLIYQPLEFLNTIPLRSTNLIFQVKMKASSAKTIKIAILENQAAATADTMPAAMVSAWNVDGTDPTLATNVAVVGSVQSCNVTTAFQTFSVTGNVPGNSKNLMVAIWTDADFAAADILYLAEAGLYSGTTVRAWQQILYSIELNRCRRYYWKTFEPDTGPAQNAGAVGVFRSMAGVAGANTSRYQVRLPVSMRAVPTCTSYNPSAANDRIRDGAAGADGGTPSFTASTSVDAVDFNATGNAASAVGNPMTVHISAEAGM